MIQAHPFVMQNFKSPYLCERDGEFIAIVNKEQTIFLLESSSHSQSFDIDRKKFDGAIKLAIRAFQLPVIVLTNGTPNVAIIRNNFLEIFRLPIFLMARYCAILDPNIVAVGDKNHVFLWNVEENKCKLLFTSSSPIIEILSGPDRLFVLTQDSLHVVFKGAPVSTVSLSLPENPKLISSYDSNALFVYGDDEVIPILIENREIMFRKTMSLPEGCLSLASIGRRGKELIGIFDAKQPNKNFIRKVASGTSNWTDPIEVPPLSIICGSSSFAIAAGSQFVLILHDSISFFTALSNKNATVLSVLEEFSDMSEEEIFDILVLQFGLIQVAAKLKKDVSMCERLVSLTGEEMWKRKLYSQWSAFALKWQDHLNKEQSTKYIIEASKNPGTPIIPFAAILEKNGCYNNAFELYLKGKVGLAINIINKCDVNVVVKHISELVGLASESIKKNERDAAVTIIRFFCFNDIEIKPEKVLSSIKFDWDLLCLYYETFERPPMCVIEAYLEGMATNEPHRVMKFLKENKVYDKEKTCNLLLRLGMIDEYCYLVSEYYPEKYVEFLVFKQKWDTLFEFIDGDKKLVRTAAQIASYNDEYFKEFAKRLKVTGVTASDIVKEIPEECPASNLSVGFNLIGNKIYAGINAEIKVREICHDETFKILKRSMARRTTPKIVKL